MPQYRVQHCFQDRSNLAEDRYCNVFHIASASAVIDGTTGPVIAGKIKDFYGFTGASEIAHYMADFALGVGRTIKIYDLADSLPRVPRYEEMSTAEIRPASTAKALPGEVSYCLSFEGIAAPGTVRARRRGRIYLGPWNDRTLLDATGAVHSKPFDMVGLCLTKAVALRSALSTEGFDWCVYSPTDSAMVPIRRFWNDDAWDTQRRRGNRPTLQTEALWP
jgi:hypothetical protein